MDRRDFLRTAPALPAAAYFAPAADPRPPRMGLIGTGWYGKCSLLRLLQVAPVEVVALCDVDKKMLAEAASFSFPTYG